MFRIETSVRFKRDVKTAKKRGYDINKLDAVVKLLSMNVPLPGRYNDHPLTGNYNGFRECHITADWLLIYKVQNDILTLYLLRTGTHSDLF